MGHDEGNTLKSQDNHEGLRALPLNSVECENFSRRRRGYRFEMHTIAQVLDPCCQPIYRVMPPSLVKIVGPQFPVRCMAGEHRKDMDHDGVGDGEDRPAP
jgi:hypothetical protein